MRRVTVERRRAARLASAAAVVLLTGLLAGPGAASEDEVDAAGAADYDCRFAGGELRAETVVEARFPAAAEAGSPIRPEAVSVGVTLDPEEVAALFPEDPEHLTGTAELSVEVAHGSETATARWQDLGAGAEVRPGQPLVLRHTGPVPSVTVGSAGEARFTAGRLTLALTATGPDRAEAPPTRTLDCAAAPGEDTRLATVRVTGPGGPTDPATGSEAPGTEPTGRPEDGDGIDVDPVEPAAGAESCPPELPTGEIDFSEALPPPDYAPPPVPGRAPAHGCAYALGYAGVKKLNGAMVINDPERQPAVTNVIVSLQTQSVTRPDNYSRIDSLASLDLPDAESTFLTFGFQPVTAKVSFENGPLSISTGSYRPAGGTRTDFAVIAFRQSLRLHDVKVNGTPLDVGPDCRTKEPFKVVLRGKAPEYANVLTGGRLRGDIAIPEFSGCGTGGEDLDPLFTAAISGPGNHVEFAQEKTCTPTTTAWCPPAVPPLPAMDPER